MFYHKPEVITLLLLACTKSDKAAQHNDSISNVNPNDFVYPALTAEDIILATIRRRPTNDLEEGMAKTCIKFNEKWGVNTSKTVQEMLEGVPGGFDPHNLWKLPSEK